MAEPQSPPPLPRSQPAFGKRHNTIIKLLGVGALGLLLLIPLAMITGVLNERLARRNEAVTDITSSWGKEQNVIGPVLGIPFQYRFKAVKEVPLAEGRVERREVEEAAIANAYFLPQLLKITGEVQTQTLHRGIYDAAVFRAQVVLSGKFATPDFGAVKIDPRDMQWKDAFVTIAVESHAKNPRDAQRQNAEAMTAVQQRLAQARVARDAVRTLGYGLEQEFDFLGNAPRMLFSSAGRARHVRHRLVQDDAFERIAGAMADDGWLMLGAGETVIGQTSKLGADINARGLYRLSGDGSRVEKRASCI